MHKHAHIHTYSYAQACTNTYILICISNCPKCLDGPMTHSAISFTIVHGALSPCFLSGCVFLLPLPYSPLQACTFPSICLLSTTLPSFSSPFFAQAEHPAPWRLALFTPVGDGQGCQRNLLSATLCSKLQQHPLVRCETSTIFMLVGWCVFKQGS